MTKAICPGQAPHDCTHTKVRLDASTDLSADAVRNIRAGVNGLLADVLTLYLKSRNFQ